MVAGPLGVVAIDFDGVLHSYKSGWLGDTILEDPTPGAQEFCDALIILGYDVVIYSTRAEKETSRRAMREWLEKHQFPNMPMTHTKPMARIYIDDRGFRFEGNFHEAMAYITANPELKSWCQEK